MAGSGSGGSGGGMLSGGNKVAAAVVGGTIIGLITWFATAGGGGGGSSPNPTRVTVAETPSSIAAGGSAAPTTAPRSAPPSSTTIDRDALTAGYPEGALLTIVAHGLPARVSATFEDEENSVYTRGTVKNCAPDELFPDPCIYYWLVKKGSIATVSAGDSRAGYWPALGKVSGPGCNLTGDGRDVTCTITLGADTEITATFYGGESPGLARYTYPVCPTNRPNPPAWASRCR